MNGKRAGALLRRGGYRALLSAVGRPDQFGRGVTMLTVDRWTLAEELSSFGEDALHGEALEMSDEDVVRVWVLAGRLWEKGKARSVGEAAALAAVSVIEGRPRPLHRKRRRPQARRLRLEQTTEERLAEIHRVEDSDAYPDTWR
jgi:hypothetical protein